MLTSTHIITLRDYISHVLNSPTSAQLSIWFSIQLSVVGKLCTNLLTYWVHEEESILYILG